MKKRILAMMLAIVMIVSIAPVSYATENDAEQFLIEEDIVEDITEETLHSKMMAAESVAEMYAEILDAMNNNMEELTALTADEIEEIRTRVEEIDPELDDEDTRDLLDTIAILPNGGDVLEGNPEQLATGTISSNATWVGSVLTDTNTDWTFQNGAVITLDGPITIPNGKTLKIKGWGGFARSSSNTSWLFIVEEGGSLIIEGTSELKPFTIDGKNVIANTGMISSAGVLNLKNTVVQNGKNRSVNATSGAPNGAGGGFVVTAAGSLQMENCTITRNTSSVNAGGFISYGPVNIKNSTISYNRAMSTETGPSVVNAGRGGGFYLSGTAAVGVFENVRVTQNAAMYYGGGGQVSGGAKLTIKGNTKFDYNTAVLHGAGALHVTGDATFTMDGGIMENNTAQTVGGAIHSSYTCVLNLNSGKILDNTANGRGGGINVNTGGTITLGAGLEISGNKVFDQATGSSAKVDATGDNWSDVKYEGTHSNNGYGGAVCLDSAECSVQGAIVKNNYAKVGGGAIALVMINASVWDHIDDLKCVNFTMTSGEISGNTTNGNGAGVYLMSNKIDESLHFYYDKNSDPNKTYEGAVENLTSKDLLTDIPTAHISGGTISSNIATNIGGGLYLDKNTKFIISEVGDVSENNAIDGAGVYIASGTAEIKGGTMNDNKASSKGGALYVAGTVVMSDGAITNNEAVDNGGAIYITGGDFTMTSGIMSENKATGTTSNGGGAYVYGGNVVIGIKDCSGEDINHTVEPTDKAHPVIQYNSAVDSGGGIALIGKGNITMYCGNITNNTATNRGRGLNIYMEDGLFDYYKGNVGKLESPELVIVGGTLNNNNYKEGYLTLEYYHCNDQAEFPGEHQGDLSNKTAYVTKKAYFNLPDGEKYWNAPEGYRFFGWTFNGPNSEAAKNHVRAKSDYKPLGEPIQALDIYGGNQTDDIIHMYALWAPEVSDITYVGSVVNGEYVNETLNMSGNPNTYTFSVASNVVTLNAPVKPGYTFVGWYMYQNEGQNANWGYDHNPVYQEGTSVKNYSTLDYEQLVFLEADSEDGTYNLEMGTTNFGDITLIAKFEEAFANIKIHKEVDEQTMNENQTFLFQITGTPYNPEAETVNMTVTISGKGEVLINHLPIGKYEVKELTLWSGQYGTVTVQNGSETIVTSNETEVILAKADSTETITFTNIRTDDKWLIGDCYCENWFHSSGIIKNREK